MKNYYETLGVSTSATGEEIQSVIDGLYNQWRQAVTHPDASVVDEANRSLRGLEQMRSILTDPQKRAAYDAGIGLSGAVGLADPTAIMNKALRSPPSSKKASVTTDKSSTADLWVCTNCTTNNPPQTRHCFKCGSQLVRKCPNCGQVSSLVATGFCGHCGASYVLASQLFDQRQQRTEAAQRVQSLAQELRDLEARVNGLVEPSPPAGVYLAGTLIVAVGLWILFTWILPLKLIALTGIGGAVVWVIYSARGYGNAKDKWESEVNAISQRVTQLELETEQAIETIEVCDFEIARLEKQLS